MQKSRIRLCSVLLLLFAFMVAFGVTKKTNRRKMVQIDTAVVKVTHTFNGQEMDQLKKDKDFDYSGNGVGDEPSLWARFWAWLWDKILGGIGSVPHGGYIILYTLLTGAIVFLVYVILKSVGIDMVRLLRGQAPKIDVPYSESTENIHEINFDEEIEKAISQHNYRLAVRLLYLKCLKQLSDSRIIEWQVDKTNQAYINEVSDTSYKQTFTKLTREFEYTWYGNLPITQQAFANIFNLFQDFKTKLS